MGKWMDGQMDGWMDGYVSGMGGCTYYTWMHQSHGSFCPNVTQREV